MKKIALLGVGVLGALSLVACGGGTAGAPASSDGEGSGAAAEIRVWLVGEDTPDKARDYLKKTFEDQNPGSTLVIEEQQWTGLVDKYTTALSGSDAPDVVELGNTQAAAFTSAGAFAELSDKYEELGGSDLLPGFVAAGSYDGVFYAAPYYSGGRVVFYTPQVAGSSLPKTLDEYVAAGKRMHTEDPKVSGIYAPGKDWYNVLPFVWENGGFIAEQKDGRWEAGFSSEGGLKGLEQMKEVYQDASAAPKDGDENNAEVPFCDGAVGYLPKPSWFAASLKAPADDPAAPGCPEGYGKDATAFALPGKTEGRPAVSFAGGSSLAIPAKSEHQELGYRALRIMLSQDYQELLAAQGMIPGLGAAAAALPQDPVTKAAAAAAAVAKATPAAPKWADVEASKVLQDSFVRIAQGEDVKQVAVELDDKIESILNS